QYTPGFYRATWILTALDAGFFTAMPLRPAFLRHICSVLFSFYYLIFADEAEDRVRRVRATMSVDQIRLSWEKVSQNPILRFVTRLSQPRMTIKKILFVERPNHLPPTEVHFFYAKSPETLKDQTSVFLQFPGGGFVSMPPQCHEDALTAWAKQTGMPVVSINYKKAPEYPYPWPVEECFDFYATLVRQRGEFLGLSSKQDLKVVIVGDSAGGNLGAAVILKILDHNKANPADPLPVPTGLVLIYPALDFEMTCWMTPSQLSLIRSESTNKMIRSKSFLSLLDSKDHLSHVSPLSVVPDVEKKSSVWKRTLGLTPMAQDSRNEEEDKKQRIRDRVREISHVKTAWETSRVAMTSRMSFFSDRVLTFEMMRALAILYIGPHATTDIESDYYLSPIVAPFDLLAQFPKTYMICGEKDPFVDDTVIFGGRIRQAKQQRRRTENLEDKDDTVLSDRSVRIKLLEGFSHGFLNMMSFLPEAHQAVRTISDWVLEIAEGRPCEEDTESDTGSPVDESSRSQALATTMNNTVIPTTHIDHIVTTEVDMINRRKSHLVSELLAQKVTQ
ncbi:Alpha/Beta hydrolase protein, partial [Dichotomocladium elegans]